MIRKLFFFVVLSLLSWQIEAQMISSFPHTEDFEGETQGSGSCGTYTMQTAGWSNDPGDDTDWQGRSGTTSSSNTGPTANGGADHNPGTSAGRYMYIESSSPCYPSKIASLISPDIDLSNTTNMFVDFWFHMYGSSMGTMHFDVSTDGGTTWTMDYVPSWTDNQDLWQKKTVNLTSFVGDTIKIRIRGITGTSFGSDMAIDDFKFYQVFDYDAGVVSIDSPLVSVPVGMNNIAVTVENFGAIDLDTVTVQWQVNGMSQSDFTWSNGPLSTNNTDGPVTIGSFNFPQGVHKIKAWTTMPNGQVDSAAGNDTSEITVCTPLKGTYTLAASGGDFSSLAELSSLLSGCGVDSHVVVNVMPGTYVGRLNLDHVPGSGSSATITINGMDKSLVTFDNDQNYGTVFINGTDYVTVKNITIQNLGTSNAFGVHLRDTAEYNTIDSCNIVMATGATSSTVAGIVASDTETSTFSEGQNALWTTVSNTTITGGYFGIHFEGASTLRNVGNVFTNNVIDSATYYGFYMDDQDSMTITHNKITNVINNSGDGIYTFDIQMFNISYNEMIGIPDYGLYIADGNYSLDGTPTSRGKIINNMISSKTDYGMYLDDFELTDIWHNTVYNESGFSGAIRINDFTGLDIKNNVFVSESDYAFESDEALTATANTMDNNVYWTGSSSTLFVKDGGNTHADLLAWQTAEPTINMNSVEGDPVFTSTSDLHLLGGAANDMGDNAVGITDDIDGDARPATGSTIVDAGADEYTPLLNDASMVSIIEPAKSCGDSSTAVVVVVRNLGQDTIFTMPITVNVSGDLTQVLNFTYNDTLPFNKYDTVTVGTIITYSGGTYDFNGFTQLVGDEDNSNDSASSMGVDKIPYEPKGIDGYACGGVDSALIYAEMIPGVNYEWYSSATDTVILGNGTSFMVPSVSTQGTYYLAYASLSDSVTIGYPGGNGQNGNMFDVTTTASTSISGFDVNNNASAGSNSVIEVYYITNSSYLGNETNAGAWTLEGSYNVTSAGGSNPTHFDLTSGIPVTPGQTTAIYVTVTSGQLNYTNGSSAGSVWATDGVVTVYEGVGKSYPFGSTFNPRNFNGAIYYGGAPCSNIRTAVSAIPTPNPSGSFTDVENGLMVNFDASASTADSANWDFGDSNTGSGTTTSHTYAADGVYTVCLYAMNNCGTDTTCMTDSICGTMTAAFNAVFAGTAGTFSYTGTGTPVSYLWNFGDGTTDTTANPTHVFSTKDTSTVTLTVTNLCGETSKATNMVTNIADDVFANSINIYPNPNKGQFTLKLASDVQANYTVNVRDIVGKTVYSENFSALGNVEKAINLNTESGVYMVEVINGGKRAVFKVVVKQ